MCDNFLHLRYAIRHTLKVGVKPLRLEGDWRRFGEGISSVSTLNQGYLLLMRKGVAPVQRLKTTWRIAPNGQVQECRVARKGSTSWCSSLRPDPRRKTPDPRRETYQSKTPRRYVGSPGRPQHWQGPGTGRTPTKVGVRCWHVSRPCRALPTAVAWLVARHLNQWAKPGIKPTQPSGLCIYC
jgi:hypothetical protein